MNRRSEHIGMDAREPGSSVGHAATGYFIRLLVYLLIYASAFAAARGVVDFLAVVLPLRIGQTVVHAADSQRVQGSHRQFMIGVLSACLGRALAMVVQRIWRIALQHNVNDSQPSGTQS